MFEQFVKRPFHLALYRTGPYAEERSRFRSLGHSQPPVLAYRPDDLPCEVGVGPHGTFAPSGERGC